MINVYKRCFPLFLVIPAMLLLTLSVVRGQPEQRQTAETGPTLASIQARGDVACGVNQSLYGFGYLDPNTGEISGFDVDFCKALAVAVFGDAEAARLLLHTVESGAAALLSGEIDVLFHNVSENVTGDTGTGLAFGPANFFNGQTIMVQGDSGLTDWDALAGATLCVVGGDDEFNLAQAMRSHSVNYESLTYNSADDAETAFLNGRCDAYSGDWVELAVQRWASPTPLALVIWEQPFTVEPLAPVYRYGDEQWGDLIKWTVMGLIRAEELGVTSENVDDFAQEGNENQDQYTTRVGPDIARLLGKDDGPGSKFGLANDYLVTVIRQLGNYGEIYGRHLGPDTPLQMPRGLNSLWSDGGLLFTPGWN